MGQLFSQQRARQILLGGVKRRVASEILVEGEEPYSYVRTSSLDSSAKIRMIPSTATSCSSAAGFLSPPATAATGSLRRGMDRCGALSPK